MDVVYNRMLKELMRVELTKCISQLQVLDAEISMASDEDFGMGKPDDHEYYQCLFIATVLRDIVNSGSAKDEESGEVSGTV